MRLSNTSKNKYVMSPKAWYLHYIRGLREEVVGSALPFGTAMDNALNVLLDNKKDGKSDCPYEMFEKCWAKQEINGKKENLKKSDKVRYYKSDFNELLITPEDEKLISKGYHKEWVCLRRKAYLLLDAYEKQVMPHLSEIIKVQEYIKIVSDNGEDYIMGYLDFVAKFKLDESALDCYTDEKEINKLLELKKYDDKVILFDNKTSSIKYKPESVKESGQLGLYTSNISEDHKADHEGYIVLPKKNFRKTKTPSIPIQIIIDDVLDETIDKEFSDYLKVFEGIKHGHFPCNKENCKSNPFGCPYKNYCETGSTEGLVKVGSKIDV
jgi:hypothetical protein